MIHKQKKFNLTQKEASRLEQNAKSLGLTQKDYVLLAVKLLSNHQVHNAKEK